MKELPSYRTIWNIAWPIILTLLAQNLINVIDTAFLARVGEVELGASAIGGLFYISLYMLGFGFAVGGQILIARRKGERNYREVGRIFDHSLFFLLALAVVIFLLIRMLAPPVLGMMIKSEAIYQATIEFLKYRIWGLFFAFPNALFRTYYTGISRTKYLSWSAGLMAAVNIVFGYWMIFGYWIFPKMGIAGAALASVIAEGSSLVFFIFISLNKTNLLKYQIFHFIFIPDRFAKARLFRRSNAETFSRLNFGKPIPCRNKKPHWEILRKTLEISVFIMLQNFISLAGWFMFFMIIEKMGEHPLAVSNIIRSAYLVLMLPIWAFSSATYSLVSTAIGEGKKESVIPLIRKIAGMSFSLVFIIVLLSLAFPRWILMIYTADPVLVASTIPSLYVVTGVLLLFSVVQVVFSGVSGTANTNIALVIETTSVVLYLVYVYLLAVRFHQPIHIVWTSEYAYFLFLGLFSFLYLRTGRWKKKNV